MATIENENSLLKERGRVRKKGALEAFGASGIRKSEDYGKDKFE